MAKEHTTGRQIPAGERYQAALGGLQATFDPLDRLTEASVDRDIPDLGSLVIEGYTSAQLEGWQQWFASNASNPDLPTGLHVTRAEPTDGLWWGKLELTYGCHTVPPGLTRPSTFDFATEGTNGLKIEHLLADRGGDYREAVKLSAHRGTYVFGKFLLDGQYNAAAVRAEELLELNVRAMRAAGTVLSLAAREAEFDTAGFLLEVRTLLQASGNPEASPGS